MPGLTLNTDVASHGQSEAPAPAGHQGTRRPSTSSSGASPTAPPMSPITPTFAPAHVASDEIISPLFEQQSPGYYTQEQTAMPHISPPPPIDFSGGRKTYSHSTHPGQVPSMPPPPAPPEPIDFNDNPDVLALKSAISILQLQKARATRDIQALSRAKEAALADPEGFVADLTSGKVGTQGDSLFPEPGLPSDRMDVDGEEDSSSDEEQESEDNNRGSLSDKTMSASPNHKKGELPPPQPPTWRILPKPQNVVRCPPINWSQYGVVGESLDKLHAEQVRAPTQGTPATLTPGVGGLTYEFKGGDGKQERLVGVAAPYAPGRDKVAKKGKKTKR